MNEFISPPLCIDLLRSTVVTHLAADQSSETQHKHRQRHHRTPTAVTVIADKDGQLLCVLVQGEAVISFSVCISG